MAPGGTGIPGIALILLFRVTVSSITRSAGVFIRPGSSGTPPSSGSTADIEHSSAMHLRRRLLPDTTEPLVIMLELQPLRPSEAGTAAADSLAADSAADAGNV